MRRLQEVEDAKELLNSAKDWGVWKWLTERSRIRQAVNRSAQVLDDLDERIKANWTAGLKNAYEEALARAALDGNAQSKRRYEKARRAAKMVDAATKQAAVRVKEAEDAAQQARMEAERMFEEAERYGSAGMAREASRKAIEAYELREKAIRKVEAASRPKPAS